MSGTKGWFYQDNYLSCPLIQDEDGDEEVDSFAKGMRRPLADVSVPEEED